MRDTATAVVLSRSIAEASVQGRGYDDLDPEQCWEQWQEVRGQLGA